MAEQSGSTTVRLLREGSSYLNSNVVREGAALALLTGRHMLMIGPPGENKTNGMAELFRAIDLPEEQTHVISGYKGAGEEILVNYLDPSKMEEGRLEFLPGKSLLNVVLAYVDEVGALSRVAQQALLQIMQSRRFSRAGMDYKLPLDTMFAGGNHPPEDPAVRDRFAIQVPTQLPRDLYRGLVEWAESTHEPQPRGCISWGSILNLRLRARANTVADDAVNLIVLLADQYRLTPRRVVEALIPAAKAKATMEGRKIVSSKDVVAIAPFVVMHDGDLTVERFEQIRHDMKVHLAEAERREAAKKLQASTKAWLVKGRTMRNEVEAGESTLDEHRWVETIKEGFELLGSLPNPDSFEDKSLAQVAMEVRDEVTSTIQRMMADLGFTL